MAHTLNVEFKARCKNIADAENILLSKSPVYIGLDHQKDTYFNVPNGRLKLREGNIENSLIHYFRENINGHKSSHIILYHHQADKNLKNILETSLGTKIIVDKKRKIYFIENVKFHFDIVEELGTFLEVEAINKEDKMDKATLQAQCNYYAEMFGIKDDDYLAESYSDMLLNLNQKHG